MAAESSTQGHDPTLVERLLDRQRDGWRRGERVFVEALVEGHPTLKDDRERLLELICNEMDLRASRGETPRLEEYRERFPTLGDDLRRQFEVFAALGPMDKPLESKDAHATATLKGEFAPADGEPIPPPPAVPPPEIDGYEVLGVLGRGGMGIVYKARQTAANRVVALKMILGGFADEEARARFRTEAHAVARLQHPNVVQVFEVGEHRGLPFFSLEFCAGGSLETRLKATPLPPREAARLVETLARAVHQVHECGVVHRDLKPANVLLTEDGTPKVTDFGLAKKLDEEGRTHTGAVMGTPEYMAPEQASGRVQEIGPATDVYALGAILYECLTGRPPFKAASWYDTLKQVREDDPVPPRRLNSRTPRDLETVCLKCLQKDPQRRYTSAEDLGEDLHRYQAHEPIVARPVGKVERTWSWCRRNPKDAALIAAGLLIVVLGALTYFWISGARESAERDRRDRQDQATKEAERPLVEADLLWDQAKTAVVGDLLPWERAVAAAGRAKAVIDANPVDEPTRQHVEQTLAAITAAKREAETRAADFARDERMKAELQKLVISQMQLTGKRGNDLRNRTHANADYERVFRTYYGIDLKHIDEAENRIRGSAIKPQLIDALDTWIPLRRDEQERRTLADMANRLSEPDGLHRDLREALAAEDGARLAELANRDLSAFAPHTLLELGMGLADCQAFDQAVALLRPAQRRFPADFGINLELSYCLNQLHPGQAEEAIRFDTAAVALEPDSAVARNNLGLALHGRGQLEEAVAEYRAAIRIDPSYGNAHYNLGGVLSDQGKLEEAAAEYRAAIQLDPKDAEAHNNLGNVLSSQGKLEEAAAKYRAAIQIDPKEASIHFNLGLVLHQQGKPEEAAAEYRAVIQLDPQDFQAHYNLGSVLSGQGKLEEAAPEYRAAIHLDPKEASPHNGLGNALADQGKLEEAVAEYRAAIQLDPKNRKTHRNLALALRSHGVFPDALAEFKVVQQLCAAGDPLRNRAKVEAGYTERLIERERELAAVLKGEAHPADASEGNDLAVVALAKKQFAPSVRLFADSFKAAPALATGEEGGRLEAARAAALAGCGQGEDGGKATEAERARWRKQALDWLQAEIDARTRQVGSNDPQESLAAARQLRTWQCRVDFAGVRDEAELKMLPQDEQTLWRTFWADVAALVDRAEKR